MFEYTENTSEHNYFNNLLLITKPMRDPTQHQSLFSSVRERRLWLWLLVVMAGIYSTLGLTQTLAGILRNRELLDATFGLAMLIIGVAIVTVAVRARPSGIEIGVGFAVFAAYLLAFLRMAIPEERTHLIEYSVVALLIYEALIERVQQGRHVPSPVATAIVATTLLGLVDESIQAFLPSRVFDPRDILFNILAGVMAVAGRVVVNWARQLVH